MTGMFKGKQVSLLSFEPKDVTALHAYLNHPDLIGRRYIPWKFSEILPLSLKQLEAICQAWAESENEFHLGIISGEGQELVGHVACEWSWDVHCPAVSVVIAPAQQRKGFGSEALQLVLRYLFEHTPAHVAEGWVADWNQPARAFLGKHGFQENGRMRRAGIRQGRYYDFVVADILRPEWGRLRQEESDAA